MSASDPKRTSLHCSTFAPIIRLIGAVITLQRLNLPIGRNQMPLGAFRCHARIAVAVSICLGVTATTRPLPKTRSRYDLARTSRAYGERLADEYLRKIL
jgi:hypothetical protein